MAVENFTPLTGLGGGALIGLSAAVLLLFNGDILGASGIVSSTFTDPVATVMDPKNHWKLVLLTSFMLITSLYLGDKIYDMERYSSSRPISMLGYALAGFFVGFGTRLGNGCTTGHGICGLARFSKRSFAAVMTFMFAAILFGHLTAPDSFLNSITGFLRTENLSSNRYEKSGIIISVLLLVVTLLAPMVARYANASKEEETQNTVSQDDDSAKNARAKFIPASAAGLIFAFGLHVSGMVYPSKVLDFLNVAGIWGMHGTSWDPTLMFVMGGGLIVSWISYQFVDGFAVVTLKHKIDRPMSCQNDTCEFSVPKNTTIDWELLTGAALFGVGWGIGGLCPGPAIYLAATGVPAVTVSWWPSYFIGAVIAIKLKNYLSERQESVHEESSLDDKRTDAKSKNVDSSQELSRDLEAQG